MENILKKEEQKAKLLFNNDYVLAVEISLKPGETLPRHQTGTRIVYSLSDSKVKVIEDDKETINEWKNGDFHWHEAGVHPALENVGDEETRYVCIARTYTNLPELKVPAKSPDLTEAAPDNSKVLIDNGLLRLTEVNLQSYENELPIHFEMYRIVYSLTQYEIKYLSDVEGTEEKAFKGGDIQWHYADNHSVVNIGKTPAHYLVFTFKK